MGRSQEGRGMKKCANVPPKNENMAKRRRRCLEARLVGTQKKKGGEETCGSGELFTSNKSLLLLLRLFYTTSSCPSGSPPSSRVLPCFTIFLHDSRRPGGGGVTQHGGCSFFSCINNFLSPSKGTLKNKQPVSLTKDSSVFQFSFPRCDVSRCDTLCDF